MKGRDPNDILREDGPEAVRAAADSAEPFEGEPLEAESLEAEPCDPAAAFGRLKIESIEVQPGVVDTFKVSIGGGVVVVDAEALSHVRLFNRACIAQLHRAIAPMTQWVWSAQLDAAFLAAKVPEHASEDAAIRHGSSEWKSEPTPWLVRERIPQQGVGLLSGMFSMYKSFMLIDASGSIMTGLPFLGARVARRGGALIFAAEGAADVPGRLAALIRHRLAGQFAQLDLLSRGGVDLFRLPFAYISGCRPLVDRRTVDWMVEKALAEQEYFRTEFGLDLVLISIDTMSAAAGWNNENDAAQCQMVMNHLADVSRATGAFVLALDHFGKDVSAGTRGSIVKESSADTILAILGDRKEDGTINDTRLVLRKQRSGPQGMVFPFEARLVPMGHDRDGEPLSSRVIDWNVTRPERTKPKPSTQLVLDQVLADTLSKWGEQITPDGTTTVRAVQKGTVRLAFKTAYQAVHPGANPDAVGEAFRRALRQAGKGIEGGVAEGVE